MSYLVFARKYRPMRFADVVGQRHVTVTLENAIRQDRIANAYLFSGPRGVGKTTVARILSKAINCDKGPTTEPCNECSSCREITDSRSMEVLEIDGASNRGIDEVRNLRESLRYAAAPGKYKIHIIDEVHMLTTEAFNALLKTLEEPPKNVLFIFATTEPHKVPATILSRCQRFDFKRISSNEIISHLSELCNQEGIQIDNESLRLIAHKADGSMRDSQSILDQVVSYTGENVTATDVASLLGIIDQELFFEISDLIKSGDIDGGITTAAHIFAEGFDFNEILIGMAEHFRNFLVVKATGAADELDVSEEYRQRYLDRRDDFEIEKLLQLIKIATDTGQEMRRSANARLRLEVALVKMINMNRTDQHLEPNKQVGEVKKNLSSGRDKVRGRQYGSWTVQESQTPATVVSDTNQTIESSAPVKTQAGDEATDETQTAVDLNAVENQWPQIVSEVKKRKIALGSFLSEGWPTKVQGNLIEITFSAENGFHIDSIERNRDTIQTIISEVLGTRIRIQCTKDEQGLLVKRRPAKKHPNKQEEFQKLIETNPTVKTIVETFNAVLIK